MQQMMATGAHVVYYRVSTSRQGKSGLGLAAQRAAVEHYLNGGRWRIAAEFTEVESGRNADRPQLDAALKAARMRRCPLVVANVSRLTRSVAFLTRLLEAGVDVRFADLPQIEGPTGRFMLTQMAAVAELEAGFIADRTKKALAAAKKRGKKLGGDRGQVPGRLAHRRSREAVQAKADARAADLLPAIEAARVAGAASLRAIAAHLNEHGIPTARGTGHWSAVQVARVLERQS
jgi:DNA invertase Pin-like site-specific DNA recombinase